MKTNSLTPELLHKIDAYWRAANYLSVGQIYLYDNPLLKRPLTLAVPDISRVVARGGCAKGNIPNAARRGIIDVGCNLQPIRLTRETLNSLGIRDFNRRVPVGHGRADSQRALQHRASRTAC